MPRQVYMGVDGRRDHGFRVPRPDLAGETGAPDVCSGCHADRDPAWAAAELARRFPESAHRGPSFATAFAAGRWDPAARAEELLAVAGQAETAGIVRATALDMLAPVADAGVAAAAAPLLADADPLVRGAAAGVQRGAAAAERADAAGAAPRGPAAGGADRGGEGDARGRRGRRRGRRRRSGGRR